MTLCKHLRHKAKFAACLLWLLLLSSCSQNPPTTSTQTEQIIAPANIGLTLNKAYSFAQIGPTSNDVTLSLIETYWELAIVNYALQRIWLVQKLLVPPVSSQDTNNNLGAPIARSQLNKLKALAATESWLSLHQYNISQKLALLTHIQPSTFSLNHLPLSEVRQRLPKPKNLVLDQFAKRLLKQNYGATYARLTSNFPNLKKLQSSMLYKDPMLGQYVWSEILTALQTKAQLIAPAKPHPILAQELQLAQLNLALVDYHYNYQKMQNSKVQYQAVENQFRLGETEQTHGLVSQQSVYSLSIEAMAMQLIYLQATLDTLQAYAKLLASSHLAPQLWQQSFNQLSLARDNHETLSNIIDLAPASGVQNSDHLVSISAYGDAQADSANEINSLALEEHFKVTGKKAVIAAAAELYLWQVDIIANTAKDRAQIYKNVPELSHHFYTEPSSGEPIDTLKAKGLRHDQARALCTRLKNLNQQCWVVQSEL